MRRFAVQTGEVAEWVVRALNFLRRYMEHVDFRDVMMYALAGGGNIARDVLDRQIRGRR